MSTGVMITRAQPFHRGHLNVVNLMLRENDKVLIIVSSANKSGTKRNPYDIEFRKNYIKELLTRYLTNDDYSRIKIITLIDFSKEDYTPAVKEWGRFLYYNIVNSIEEKGFTIYYNDDLSIINNWFDESIKERISIRHIERDDISSTKLREAILNDDKEYKEMALIDKNLYAYELQSILKQVRDNPKEDIMIN